MTVFYYEKCLDGVGGMGVGSRSICTNPCYTSQLFVPLPHTRTFQFLIFRTPCQSTSTSWLLSILQGRGGGAYFITLSGAPVQLIFSPLELCFCFQYPYYMLFFYCIVCYQECITVNVWSLHVFIDLWCNYIIMVLSTKEWMVLNDSAKPLEGKIPLFVSDRRSLKLIIM